MRKIMEMHPIRHQATIAKAIATDGISLHAGVDTQICLRPAPINTGIVFVRTDVTDRYNEIAVRVDAVSSVKNCTTITNAAGVSVSTIEHLLSALAAAGVDNIRVEIDDTELPALDGSSAPFLSLLEQARIVKQHAPRRYLKVLKPIDIQIGDSFARIEPADQLTLDVTIVYDDSAIGKQRIVIEPNIRTFRDELAGARTFARSQEIKSLRDAGLSKGGSLDNAIVVDGDKILNPEGLRFEDEFVRHKALDLLGDSYIAGPILGKITTVKGGHRINHALLLALLADSDAWTYTNMFSGVRASSEVRILA